MTKKKILLLAALAALAALLAIPAMVMGDDTTDISGNVVSGYTFSAPSAINLGNMTPGNTVTGNSIGHLSGNNSAGYTVTGTDAKASNKGYMVSGTNVLHNKLKIGPNSNPTATADTSVEFLNTNSSTDQDINLYVSQDISYSDTAASGYTITITFTVIEKTQ